MRELTVSLQSLRTGTQHTAFQRLGPWDKNWDVCVLCSLTNKISIMKKKEYTIEKNGYMGQRKCLI